MKLKIYHIDAFAKNIFEGNPAAVCPLNEWLDDTTMQKIAAENNLAETAFFVKNGKRFDLRWFTPTKEVNLCGHATLASAYVIFHYLEYKRETIEFNSKSGLLKVTQNDKLITMDFPSEIPVACEIPQALIDAFDVKPIEVLKCVDYIVVFKDEIDITKLTLNLEELRKLDLRGVCITARNSKYDFVCRFFAPNYGIDEDSVTGSVYTQLTPYWAKRLKKQSFTSKQLSSRGGELSCRLKNDRVFISGYGVCYMIGEINIK